jgi:hypothetical protein
MSIIYQHITASTTTQIINVADKKIIKSLLICNTSGATASFDLTLTSLQRDNTEELGALTQPTGLPKETYYILKNVKINDGVTLVVEEDELEYDRKWYHLNVYCTQTIDIIIK